jgi:hypothetical protein
MRYDRCNATIETGEAYEYSGQILCEDCSTDVLSPSKGYDPWVVYTVKSYEKHSSDAPALTPIQNEIIDMLKEAGGIEPQELLERLNSKLTLTELERELSNSSRQERSINPWKDAPVPWAW